MKLAVNLGLSLAMLALCVWLVWPDQKTRDGLEIAMRALALGDLAPYLAAYFALLVVMHVCRALRWNNLLAPLGVHVPAGPLLAISSVGFMAILALPARLGEFVRPGLLRRRGDVSASAALGTIAVERIVDGLLISLLVFGCCFALRGAGAPGWMMPMAYTALGVFAAALAFLVAAMRWPATTVKVCVAMSLLPQISPRAAAVVRDKLLELIRGFDVLRDRQNLGVFLAWSLVYWGANGLGVWVLARGFGLPLSPVGAFATMGIVAVGITLPNSPALIGQFVWFMMLGLSLYIPGANDEHAAIYPTTFAFAMVHYGLQVAWYVAMGALGLATPWVSFHDLRAARRPLEVPGEGKTGA
jgi:uncharacterized membrane protein YbhN (UPF0104 family)